MAVVYNYIEPGAMAQVEPTVCALRHSCEQLYKPTVYNVGAVGLGWRVVVVAME